MADIINGKSIAAQIRQEVSEEVDALKKTGIHPGLAVILVGNNLASEVYVNMKGKACEKAGIHSITDRLAAEISEADLLEKVKFYNENPIYHGLLVQLPLPSHIDEQKIIESVALHKDVDCFHPYNVGRLMIGQPVFEPATPAGIVELLKYSKIDPKGKHVVIVGRSNIVGKPLSMMLVQKRPFANAIVTILHTAAQHMDDYTREADILVAAIGKPEVIKAKMVKKGVVVIDVGVNRVPDNNEKGYRLVGDVDFQEVYPLASAITPVPGGVGPMTIAMLLRNTVKAAKLHTQIKL